MAKKRILMTLNIALLTAAVSVTSLLGGFNYQEVFAGTKVVFQDGFEEGITKWTATKGDWQLLLEGENNVLHSSYEKQGRIYVNDFVASDYSVTVDIKIDEFYGRNRGAYLCGRYVDANNYYAIDINNRKEGYIDLNKKVNGNTTTLASIAMNIEEGLWYNLKLEFVGTSINAYLNDELILTAEDREIATGTVGLISNKAKCNFDNLLVEENEKKVSVEDMFISENSNYKEIMDSTVQPYLNSVIETGYFTGMENANIYYEKYILDNAKASVVISHGFSENLEKYDEIIYYFLQQGYSVFALEHRGHGRSTNLGEADSTQISVKDYSHYTSDLKTFVDSVVIPSSDDNKLFLFAHSMGGGIAARFVEMYPEYFAAAVLNAPMMEVDTGSVNATLARTIANSMVRLGKGGDYVLGQGPYEEGYYFDTSNTFSKSRFDYAYDIMIKEEMFQKGGASYRWLKQAFALTDDLTFLEENL